MMSCLEEWEGYGEGCCISEFSGWLQSPFLLSKYNLSGWFFWYVWTENEFWPCIGQELESQEERQKIHCLVEAATSDLACLSLKYMLQFWAIREGRLTSVDQPFAVVGPLYKGYCWYRKLCVAHQYQEKEVGPVGRVYVTRSPESTPDLRLYSVAEFPLRDAAARCGLRTYLAVPVFDMLKKKCYGVLELVSPQIGLAQIFDQGFKKAGLTSTHVCYSSITEELMHHQPENEVAEMMKSAMELVPQLHLVQVWSPCKQCVSTSNNLSCMQRIAFLEAKDKTLNSCIKDREMHNYLEACGFHHLHIGKWICSPAVMLADGKSSFCRNVCEFSIRENPLAHYAQQARLSFCFVVLLSNHYLVEFFFQSNSGEDKSSFLHMLLKIMEKELRNFKFEKSIVELRKTSGLITTHEWKQHPLSHEVNTLMVMKEDYLLSDFIKYLEKDKLLSSDKQKICNNGVINNIRTKAKIENLMIGIVTRLARRSYRLIQFWGVGINGDRPCLQTSNQPFIFTSFHKGLAYFREQCMEHQYFVEEEVGPLQRVFKSGHPETSPDLRLYSATDFPLRDHALNCNLRTYLAVPIFEQREKCIGVLECVGIDDDDDDDDDEVGMVQGIQRALEAASLASTHIDFMTTTTRNQDLDSSRSLAEAEIFRAQKLFAEIPQLFLAHVWVTYNGCDSSSCMELLGSSNILRLGWPTNFSQVQTRKGIMGMLLAAENKTCFCRNSCGFSIADEPLSHYLQRYRLDVCFAICLQSSHTRNLLYVLQFFLHQGPATFEFLSSFLHILFPILRKQLTSFKVASGQQLGDNLVVDVIRFHEGKQITSSESHSSPFKFKIMHYVQKETQRSNNEPPHFVPDVMVMDSVPANPPSSAANSNSREKGKFRRKRNGSLNIRIEDLQPHFGKTLKQVAEALGVGKSTIKRACRRNDIDRWPSSEKYIKNPSLFEAAATSHPSGSPNLPPPNMSSLPPTNAKTTLQPVTELSSKSEIVIVKAKYEVEIIKFKLSLSSTMNNLLQEVARRLELEIGSFKLRYLDEDNDNILLASDDDLQLCFKGLTAAGDKTILQVFVQSICT